MTGDLIIHGEIDIELSNEAYHSEECFKDYIEKPIVKAGGTAPRFKSFQVYMESMAMLANTAKYLGPIPHDLRSLSLESITNSFIRS